MIGNIITRFSLFLTLLLLPLTWIYATASDNNNRLKIAIIPPSHDAFWQQSLNIAHQASEDLDVELKVFLPEQSQQSYIELVESASEWADGILFHDFSGAGETVLQRLDEKHVPSILVNSVLSHKNILPRQKYPNWIGSVMPDDELAGRILIQQLMSKSRYAKDKLHILALGGPVDSTAGKLRESGLNQFIEPLNIASYQFFAADWQAERAKIAFENAIKANPKINMVWCANDVMALAVIETIEELGLTGQISVGGVDWQPQALRHIEQGQLAVSVGGHIFDAAIALVLMHDYLMGADFERQGLSYKTSMLAVSGQQSDLLDKLITMESLSLDFSKLSLFLNPEIYSYDFSIASIFNTSKTQHQKAAQNGLKIDFGMHGWLVALAVLAVIYAGGFYLFKLFRKSRIDPLHYQFSSKKTRLIVMAGITSVASIFFVVAFVFLGVLKDKIKTEYQGSIEAVRDGAQLTLNLWANYKKDEIENIAASPEILNFSQQLTQLPYNKTALTEDLAQQALRDYVAQYVPSLKLGYFVISPNYISLASRRDQNIGSYNVIAQNYPDLIDQVFQQGKTLFIPPAVSKVSDTGYSTAFFVAPVKNTQGHVIAALSMRIDPHAVFSKILSTGRFGYSGETYAVDSNGLMVSHSRFLGFDDAQEQSISTQAGLIAARVPKEHTSSTPFTLMAESVSKGNKSGNFDGYLDYRGIPVIGSWVWDQNLNIGIASEIDYDEAFASFYQIRFVIIAMLSVFLMITVGGVIVIMVIGDAANRSLLKAKKGLEQEVDKRTEELSQRESKFRGLFESSRDALLIFRNQEFIDCNQATLNLFGFDDKFQFLSFSPVVLSPRTQLDGSSSIDAMTDYIAQAERDGSVVFEWEYLRDNIDSFICETLIQVIEWEGCTALMFGLRDITAKKQTELEIRQNDIRLQLVTQAAELADWQWDPHTQQLTGSKLLKKITGLESGYLDLKKDLFNRIKRSDLLAITPQIEHFMNSDEPMCVIEFRIQPQDDGYRWINTTLLKSKDDDVIVGVCQDISKIKAAEQLANESRHQLTMALQGAKAGTWQWSTVSEHFETDKTWAELLGYQVDELLLAHGMGLERWFGLVHEEDVEQVKANFQAFLAGTENEYKQDCRMFSKSGETLWVSISGSALTRDSKGRVETVSGLLLNVTENMLLQIELEQSMMLSEMASAEKALLINNIPGIVYTCLLDADWTMLFISDMVESVLQVKAETFIQGDKTFASMVHPDDLAEVDATVNKAVEDKTVYTIEYRMIRQDGTECWVYERGQASYDENGVPQVLHGTILDITDRKESEKQFQALMESAPECMIVVNPESEIVLVNALTETLFGYKKHELVGQKIEILLPESKRSHHSEFVRQYFANPSVRMMGSGMELLACHKNDFDFPVEVSLSPLETAQGILVCAAVRDITERKLSEQELLEAKEAAELATQAKSDFLANMSHEIRTPMNAIIGMSHLALQQELNNKARNYVDKVHLSAQSLLGIINDILDFSKIEAGKLSIEAVSFTLDELLDHFSNMLSLKASQNDIELLIDVPANIPNNLIGDPLRLKQVLINLGSNAVKFTEHGEVRLKVRVIETRDKRIMLQFEVKDSGIGMNPKQQKSLFQAFSQADSSTTRKYGGTGLGLAISKTLVELMGGKIRVESAVGEGSNFIFTCDLGLAEQTESQRLVLPAQLSDLSVLVVDDNESARDIFKEILQSFGYQVRLASSGADALSHINQAEQAFDVLLIDWMMPEMSGLQLLEAIHQRQLAADSKLVMMTAYDAQEMAQTANKQGLAYDAILNKPTNASHLYEAIVEAYGRVIVSDQPIAANNDGDWGHLAGKQILLVEDNEFNQELATDLLESEGLIVTLAENGQEAVDILEQQRFDLVLMDCQMPVMDGFAATEKLRERPELDDLPIIAMTANVMASDIEKTAKAGMNDHIGKPIDVNVLFSTMAKWLPANEHANQKAQTQVRDMTKRIPVFTRLDVDRALTIVGGKLALYEKLLKRFVDSNENWFDDYQVADVETKTRIAHSIKGIAGNLGAKDVQRLAGELEALWDSHNASAGSPDSDAKTTEVEHALVAEISLVIGEIKAHFNQLEAEHNPAADGTEVPKEVLIKQVNELIVLIDDFDSKAMDMLEELAAHMRGEAHHQALVDANDKLQSFEYDEALEVLKDLLVKLD
ncbi:response regulator [Catenovulum sp. SM1970]|uniref:response regulator n=1 Tax=Marinifaba aquimaris TaxID=2741323 RepID=UPI0015717DD8|nr:response regulator [Marinifaba aquimaris]NTS77244.1 response regulator [Marinifaba aquimaris]